MAVTSRVWELVTNLKDENNQDLMTLERLKEVLEERSVRNNGSIVNYAYIVHDKDVYTKEKILKEEPDLKGQPKRPHVHVVMKFTYNQELDRLSEWFGISPNFFERGRGRGAWEEKLLYLTHRDEKQQALGKHLYSDDEVISDFDYTDTVNDFITKKIEMKSRYGKTNLSDKEVLRLDVLQKGMTLRQAMDEKPLLFAQDHATLSKLRGYYLGRQDPPVFRLNLYISGSGGIGKDLMARALARSMFPTDEEFSSIVFEIGANGSEFEGYDGQPVVIWSDVRAGELIGRFGRENLLSGILEPFQQDIKKKQNIKYSSVSLVNQVNIFTGADDYRTFLDGLVGEYTDRYGNFFEDENKAQSYRRFPLIIPVFQDDFDILLNEGFMNDNSNWSNYLHYKNVIGSFSKLNAMLSGNEEKKREIEGRLCSPVISTIGEVMEKTNREPLSDEEIENTFADYGRSYAPWTSHPFKEYPPYEPERLTFLLEEDEE